MLSRVFSSSVFGIDGYIVGVEIDISAGLPSFSTVGLPDTSIRESKDRVISAVKNSGFDFPVKKITVNLTPADIKKEGPLFDLPIAIGILLASEQLKSDKLSKFGIVGELSLDGTVRKVKGVLPIAIKLKDENFEGIILPDANKNEASVVKGLKVIPVNNLKETVEFLKGESSPDGYSLDIDDIFNKTQRYDIDFHDVKGQVFAKRALEIASAGSHNILLIGPPGSGKTMLTKRIPTILPELSLEEAIETTKIHSISGLIPKNSSLVPTRPFRSPHHTISDIALIGGGQYPRPGEVSLANNGVLFLDELPEFHRNVLEVLRQPIEDGVVTISRATTSLTYPARFMLVCAMNPCPCGFYGHPTRECNCTPYSIQKYISKISGPLLDRIDIHIGVPALRYEELADESSGESSEEIRNRVKKARQTQRKRFKGEKNIFANAHMETRHLKKFCELDSDSKKLIKGAIEKLGLSARAYDRILKVARTISDLEGKENLESFHIAEAIQYRCLDRNYSGL